MPNTPNHLFVFLLGLVLAAYSYGKPEEQGREKPPILVNWSAEEPSVTLDFGEPFRVALTAPDSRKPMAVRPLPVWMQRDGGVLFGNAVESGTFVLEVRSLENDGWSPPERLKIIVPERNKTMKMASVNP